MDINDLKNTMPDLFSASVSKQEMAQDVDVFDEILFTYFEEYGVKAIKMNITDPLDEAIIINQLKDWKFKVDKKFKLSQSTIKSFWNYANGDYCGRKFKESIFDKKISLLEESPSMVHGQIFEYLATGQKNYHNQIPDLSQIEKKNGNITKVGEVVNEQVDNWKRWIRVKKVLRPKINEKWKLVTPDYIITASPDYFCQIKKKDTIVDLKYGEPDGTYGDFAWHDSKLPLKKSLHLQAKQYLFIKWKEGVNADFIFYIASKSNPKNVQAKQIVFKDFEKSMKEYEQFLIRTYKAISFLLHIDGFVIKPEIKNCYNCDVKNCSSETSIAEVKQILID